MSALLSAVSSSVNALSSVFQPIVDFFESIGA